MNALDILLLLLIAAALAGAVRLGRSRRKNGGCCQGSGAGCASCGGCAACKGCSSAGNQPGKQKQEL